MSPESCIVQSSSSTTTKITNFSHCTDKIGEEMEIEVGSFYKIDNNNSSVPVSLSSIKAVMVEEKSGEEVTVKYPSTKSLESFFNEEKRTGLMQPNLDDKCVMSLILGKKLLTQKISFQEFASQRGNPSFWSVDFDHHDHDQPLSGVLDIKWGKRKKFTFNGKHRTSILPCITVKKCDDNDGDEDDQGVASMDEDCVDEKKPRILRKRKCNFKGVKYTEKKRKKSGQKKFGNSQHRWTVERYKLAEKSMLEIMKAKGAVPGNPVLRPYLRAEARTMIGDTGLLDHLLKHMAGKLAPGGKERFRRRHNPEGAMEYWLESADLVEIRKREGIDDPFWVPPPGWKPGDSPTHDPVCAIGIKELKEEVANMKREMGKLACKGQENNQALTTVPAGQGVERLGFLGSLKPLKAMYADLVKKKVHVEKQLLDISESLSGMEEEVGVLKASSVPAPTAVSLTQAADQKVTKGLSEDQQKKAKRIGAINGPETSQDKEDQSLEIQENQPTPPPESAEKTSEKEEKRAKDKEEWRQRLSSTGFRICKPQGTFLWPSQMASSSSFSSFDFDDLLGYPTPPSVSSSSSTTYKEAAPLFFPPPPQHHRNNHRSPVKKPVATRAAVTLTISTATIRGSTTIESITSPTYSTTTGRSTITNAVPDLNEMPISPFMEFPY